MPTLTRWFAEGTVLPAEICFSADADTALAALEADPAQEKLVARINASLDRLSEDPGDASVRRRRFQNGLWLVMMWDRVILWEPHPEKTDAVIVHYIGPDSF